ncbi:A/G-specific adenine glycosylase [Bacillus solimangrovi]|uniref:Adenine DNA glycosylase n=1 Tax=Bacillus solimangrovi TaxID=1305675 RepID=A0A1E5LBP9_9BACI|nr:A/G-specific adenine glycosylase [Bacillus solimangrovi]OEH91419.1 A/G-specific adenine glycosylase [Bacillus solimangrovi]
MYQQWIRDFEVESFRNNLVTWFQNEQRDLPWRHNQTPYKVWISEVMLQQTRVDTVIPYYKQFLELFPSLEALAEADEQKVLKAWEGLGYYSRARNLHSAVKEVHEKYDGVVPEDPKQFGQLKGVGPYTQGAVLSIAYGKPEPAVDGNVMRVLSRIMSIWDDIAKPKTRKLFEELVRILIDTNHPSDFNQGLMELGALICTPKTPNCLLCPVREQCRAFSEGVQAELPVKSRKKPPRSLEMTAVILRNSQGELLIRRRPSTGLLANLWEFPNHEMVIESETQVDQLKAYIEEDFNIKVNITKHALNIKHVFSHLIWNIKVYEAETTDEISQIEGECFVNRDQLRDYPFPVSHQKIIEYILND